MTDDEKKARDEAALAYAKPRSSDGRILIMLEGAFVCGAQWKANYSHEKRETDHVIPTNNVNDKLSLTDTKPQDSGVLTDVTGEFPEAEYKEWIERLIIERGFATYVEAARWGFERGRAKLAEAQAEIQIKQLALDVAKSQLASARAEIAEKQSWINHFEMQIKNYIAIEGRLETRLTEAHIEIQRLRSHCSEK